MRTLIIGFTILFAGGTVAWLTPNLVSQPPAPGVGGPEGQQRGPGRGAQRGPGGPGGGPGGRGGPGAPDRKMVKEFDKDGDGVLNTAERALAREALKKDSQEQGPGRRRGPGGPGGNREPGKPGPQVRTDDVAAYPDRSLYDPAIVRTLFLQFENDDWEKELAEFKLTDVDVPAQLTVDGKVYPDVGVSYRGMSSFFMIPEGLKRSLNLTIDFADKDQQLYGYRTLNLLNCNGDASMMSSALYSFIASQKIATPKVNFVKVVINGESWGIYCNSQQFNKDFLEENFDTTGGARWKVSGSPRGDGGLRYLGEDVEPYRERFEIKSKDNDKSWRDLIHLCKVLNETPVEKLEEALSPILDIDGALWFLAVDVALVNSDGYWTRASDYNIYQDPSGQFHILPHDMNEAFHGSRGGGPGGPPGFGGGPPGFGRPPGGGGFWGFGPPPGGGRPPGFGPPPGDGPPPGNDANRPRGERGRPQDGDRPRRDRGGRGGFGGPGGGPGGGGPGHGGVDLDPLVGLDDLAKPLRSRLLANEKLKTRYLQHVRTIAEQLNWETLGPRITQFRVLLADEVAADTRKLTTTEAFLAATSPDPVEKDAPDSLRSFIEKRSEFLLNHDAIKGVPTEAVSVLQTTPGAGSPAPAPQALPRQKSLVVISEIMASNNSDTKGKSEDWIELFNSGDEAMDLSGMYLSDDPASPHKWPIPAGTMIGANSYLLVWADSSKNVQPGLHANFKLSKKGEIVTLASKNAVLSEIKFPKQTDEVSFGLLAEQYQPLTPTPGARNVAAP